ncbi:MAG: hypothetical protein AB7I33_12395 [Gemmatimonadales bacterium]
MPFLRRLLPFALLLSAGCKLFNGDCTYETRSLVLEGPLAAPGSATTLLGDALVSLNEISTGEGALNVYLTTPEYLQIQTVDLLAEDDQGTTTLARWTAGNTTTPGQWYSNVYRDLPSFGQLSVYARLQQLYVVANIGGQPGMRARLRVTVSEGWHHPNCS